MLVLILSLVAHCVQGVVVVGSDVSAIRDAIAGLSGPDVVTVPAGTYTGCVPLDIEGKTFTLQGAGAETTIIDCEGADVILFESDCKLDIGGLLNVSHVNTTIRDITIQRVNRNPAIAPFGSRWNNHQGGAVGRFLMCLGPSFIGVHFINNTISGAVAAFTGRGGALRVSSSGHMLIRDCVFDGNSAAYGGAVYMTGTLPLEIESCTFRRNTCTFNGGAVFLNTQGSLDITDSQFNENTASWGGGMFVQGGGFVVVSSTNFTGNSGENGGAVHVRQPTRTCAFIDVIITGNTAIHGGGLYSLQPSTNVSLMNVVIAGNTAETGGGLHLSNYPVIYDVRGPTYSNCLLKGNTAVWGGGVYVDGGGRIASLRFEDNVAVRGGGIAVFTPDDEILELLSSHFVNNRAELDGGAIYGESAPIIARDVTLEENSANTGGGLYFGCDIMRVPSDDCGSARMSMSDSGIYGGEAERGGGVALHHSNVSFSNVTISRNTAASGGALVSSGAMVHASSLLVSLNAAETGGGFHLEVGSTLSGTVTIANNSASTGGGLYLVASSADLDSSTFSGNSASVGGGLNGRASWITITGTTFSENTATREGGGIVWGGMSASIASSTFDNNRAGGSGGGIFYAFSTYPAPYPEPRLEPDNTFINNVAFVDSGIIAAQNYGSSPVALFFDQAPPQAVESGEILSTNTSFDSSAVLMAHDAYGEVYYGDGFIVGVSLLTSSLLADLVCDNAVALSVNGKATFEGCVIRVDDVESLGATYELIFEHDSGLSLRHSINITTCSLGKAVSTLNGFLYCGVCPFGTKGIGAACEACAAGTFQDSVGAVKCKPCPLGSYNILPGQSSCSSCDEGTYSLKPTEQCIACPKEGRCPDGVIYAKPGYWQFELEDGTVEHGRCPLGHCLGDNQCSSNRIGDLCAICLTNHVNWQGQCINCPKANPGVIIGFIVLIVCFVVYTVFYQVTKSARFKILTFFGQTMGIITQGEDLRIPTVLSSSWKATSLSPEYFPGVCLAPIGTYGKTLMTLFTPFMLFLLLVIVYVLEKHVWGNIKKDSGATPARDSRRLSMLMPHTDILKRHRYRKAVFAVVLFVYVPVTQVVLSMLPCRSPHPSETNVSYLVSDLSIQCTDSNGKYVSSYLAWRIVCILLAILVVFPLPFCVFGFVFWLKKNRDLADPDTGDRYGILFIPFNERVYWWEGILQLRKLVVVSLSVLISEPELRRMALLGFFCFLVVTHMNVKPYKDELENFMELGSLCVLAGISVVLASAWARETFASVAFWVVIAVFVCVPVGGSCGAALFDKRRSKEHSDDADDIPMATMTNLSMDAADSAEDRSIIS